MSLPVAVAVAIPLCDDVMPVHAALSLLEYAENPPRRSFILAADGTLSYSRTQGEKQRDSLDITKASIGRSKKRRHIVIDSLVEDKLPWHCKALSEDDFEKCVVVVDVPSFSLLL